MKAFLFILLLFISAGLPAQNRIIVNPGFNNGPGLPVSGWSNVESNAGDSPEIDGWYTTHSPQGIFTAPIEVWCDGYSSTPSQEGSHFVELNASEPSRLYQIVYLVNGENINWEYYHRNRPGGLSVQTIQYNIYSEDGLSKDFVIDTYHNSTSNSWTQREGSFVVTVPTGIYQIGFESTEGTSYGNLLDNVTIELEPLVEFARTSFQSEEGDGIVPHLILNGRVHASSSVTIKINYGTASNFEDYSHSGLSIDVPIGNYAISDSIPIPFTIIDDKEVEGNETISFEIESVNGDLLQQDSDGYNSNENTCLYTIIDDDFLPITLTSFEAELENKVDALIQWETASEINNDFFTVEKSRGLKNWSVVGDVPGAGNSNIEKRYFCIDKNIEEGDNYYRLKQTDVDGQSTYSMTEKVILTLSGVKLYPNPVSDFLYIELANSANLPEVYNVMGSRIHLDYDKRGHVSSLDFSNQEPGFYIIIINKMTFKVQCMQK